MTTPHKHAVVIKAWADGAVVQKEIEPGRWMDCPNPHFDTRTAYRIKPTHKPLGEVAVNAWLMPVGGKTTKEMWQAVADAVVAAYKEQQA